LGSIITQLQGENVLDNNVEITLEANPTVLVFIGATQVERITKYLENSKELE